MNSFNYIVASQQPIKLEAVKDALESCGISTDVMGEAVKSMVSEQPIGYEETMRGCKNRLETLRNGYPHHYSCIISIENGLINKRDRACICVWHPVCGELFDVSDGHSVLNYYDAFMRDRKEDQTIGDFVRPGSHDWSGRRKKDISETLEKLFIRMQMAIYHTLECMPDVPPSVEFKGVDFFDVQQMIGKDRKSAIGVKETMRRLSHGLPFNKVAFMSSRGYLFVDAFYGYPKIMLRKGGKTPGKIVGVEYGTEYSQDKLELAKGLVDADDSVLIVDDLIATGGSINAAQKLLESCGATVVGAVCLLSIDMPRLSITIPVKVAYVQGKTWKASDFALKSNDVVRFGDNRFYLGDYRRLGVTDIPFVCDSFTYSPRVWIRHGVNSDIWNIYADVTDNEAMNQLYMLVMNAHRKDVCKINIYLPFLDTATQDRIEYKSMNGILMESIDQLDVTIRKIERLVCPTIKLVIHTHDMHVGQSRFNDVRDSSTIPYLLKRFIEFYGRKFVVVFPDAGAKKRFSRFFVDNETCSFIKERYGKERFLRCETPKMLEHHSTFLVVDDIVRSGETLNKVRKYIKQGKPESNIFVMVPHCPMEGKAVMRMSKFNDVFTTDSKFTLVKDEWIKHRTMRVPILDSIY